MCPALEGRIVGRPDRRYYRVRFVLSRSRGTVVPICGPCGAVLEPYADESGVLYMDVDRRMTEHVMEVHSDDC